MNVIGLASLGTYEGDMTNNVFQIIIIIVIIIVSHSTSLNLTTN